MNSTSARYDAAALTHYAAQLLQRAGLAETMARTVADTLVQGDLLGHDTHGLALLAGYVKELESGAMKRDGAPLVISDRPAAVLWDGQRLPGPWLVHQGLDLLLPRARELGTASLVIRRSHHIACLAAYLLRALEEDMLLVLACSDPNTASVAPFGGTQAVFTPNPLALGFPIGDGGVMVDISASITTNGMSNRKRQAGETFDHEVLIDAKGLPSKDPAVLFEQPPGTLLPVGGQTHGHKGYGLALLVESLTGGLAGHGRADPPEGWGATVYLTLHDLHAFGGKAAFLRQMDHVAAQCRTNPPVDAARPVRLPGERGLQRRAEQLAAGVHLAPSIAPALQAAEQRYGLKLAGALR
ncbi:MULTISPECIES: Ldh family oxidoreductase [unclassified Variovorax]|uniref:Ldh family oxidoreductase n=1 Tax=unclassified Variovorax TaxID=663243 RepID=UPI00076C40AA|nr:MULTISPECIES: Ldh family oxidoreductase [unclassified Variovorax]KWT85165.1 Malate dehydrogenase [Variovorax sp. WDL1]PNG56599.1 putative oxidoreductase YbiC [Variovorax sp. B4]PNG58023.1 putative oxidoreductase YbiC [Variovorax sp. B2]VTV09498.1 putative oxidoreductase YbiC [Variovorax sp. WDL1]